MIKTNFLRVSILSLVAIMITACNPPDFGKINPDFGKIKKVPALF